MANPKADALLSLMPALAIGTHLTLELSGHINREAIDLSA
jgi:hypothetical protein